VLSPIDDLRGDSEELAYFCHFFFFFFFFFFPFFWPSGDVLERCFLSVVANSQAEAGW
jgi:hypothetical protein